MVDVDGAVVTNCVVEFIGGSFPASGTTITNVGTGGATYNGTTVSNHYYYYNGAKSFYYTASDKITVAPNTLINDQSSRTIEIGVKFTSISEEPDLFYKGAFDVYVSPSGYLHVTNNTSPTGNTINFYSSNQFVINTAYIVQIKWDLSAGPNAPNLPVVYVNGTAWTMAQSGTSSDTAWVSDATSNLNALNSSAGYIYLLRWHNALLSTGDLTTNYNASKWRFSLTDVRPQITVVPTCTTPTYTAKVSTTQTLTIVPSAAGAAYAPTPTTSQVIDKTATLTVIPGCTITQQAAIPLTLGSWSESTIPTCTTTTFTVAKTITSNILLSKVPGCTTASIAPTTRPNHEENCIVKYSTWPSGITITNEGTGGSAYDGTAAANRQVTLPSGVTAFSNTQTTDIVTIPHGTLINNFSTLTVEFLFRIDSSTTSDVVILGRGYEWHMFYSSDYGGYFVISRYDPTLSNSMRRVYTITHGATGDFSLGKWYFVQLTWDCSPTASPSQFTSVPVLKVNNVALTDVSDQSSGTLTSWASDSADDVILWDMNGAAISQTVALFRWHNVVLTDTQLSDNYHSDWWRAGNSIWTQSVTPTATAPALAPTPSIGTIISSEWTEDGHTPRCTTNIPSFVTALTNTWTQSTTPDATSIATAPYALPVYEANCVIKYAAWPTSDTVVINEGNAGFSYNGIATNNEYVLLPSNATAFEFVTTTDKVDIPKGTADNNFTQATWEFLLRVDGVIPEEFYLLNKEYCWAISINNTYGSLIIQRYDSGWVNKRYYTYDNLGFVSGNWYFLQITWDCSPTASPSQFTSIPVVRVNNVDYTSTAVDNSSVLPVTAWLSDDTQDANLWNYTSLSAYGTLALFRWHDTILTQEQLITNYQADWWRQSSPAWIQAYTPSATATTWQVSALVGILNNAIWREQTIPIAYTGSAGVLSISEDIGIIAVPGTTSASYVPLVVVAKIWTQSVIPNCASVAFAPKDNVGTQVASPLSCSTLVPHFVVTCSATPWVQQYTPTSTTSTIAPTTNIDTALAIIPDCSTLVYTVGVAIGYGTAWSQSITPNCSTASLKPEADTAFHAVTVPVSIVGIQTPTIKISNNLTQTITPDCTARVLVVRSDIGEGWAQTVIPRCTTTTPAMGGNIINTWTQTVTPNCTTVVPQIYAALSVNITWTQTVTPTAITHIPAATREEPIARMIGNLPSDAARISGIMPGASARMLGALEWEEIII